MTSGIPSSAEIGPVLLPTDRPRRSGLGPRRTHRAEVPLTSEPEPGRLLAAIMVVIQRYTGAPAALTVGGRVTRTSVSSDATLATLADAYRTGGDTVAIVSGGAGEHEIVFQHAAGVLRAQYDTRLYDEASVSRLLGHVAAVAAAPADRPVAELPLLSPAEQRTMLLDWNATGAALGDDRCLHEVFESRVDADPDRTAVVQGTLRLSYREADAAANRLAHRLRRAGAGPGTLIGLCLGRSPRLLIAVLAVLKSGSAYVPFDPDYPPARLSGMLAGAGCTLVLSDERHRGNLPADGLSGAGLLLLDDDTGTEAVAAVPGDRPVGGASPGDLCYVIFTSGSTGVPKPIALRHRGVLNNLADLNTRFAVGPGDSVLGLSSPSFDMSVYEMLGMVTSGGTLVLPEPDRTRDPAHWAALLSAHGITIWNSAPALLELLTEELERTGRILERLRLAMLGGDWVPVTLPDRIRAHAPALRFVALGGATEASIHSTIFEVGTVDPAWTSIPYGRPMANQRTYILDDYGHPAPIGVPGELYLAGIGLAEGYPGQAEQTAERFTTWSYGPVSGERIYRTGDLARYRPDGMIELLGRRDHQVKVAGLRVELGEVEAALRAHPGVRDAVVAAPRGDRGERRLVGYVTGEVDDAEAIRDAVGTLLPPYMVPAVLVVLDRLPLSPNGKVDRAALPAPRVAGPAGGLPRAGAEEEIAAIWREVLGVAEVGRHDDFFSLGGDSMAAIRVMPRIDAALTWADIYKYPTPAELAGRLRQVRR